jgi:hypothetical protein
VTSRRWLTVELVVAVLSAILLVLLSDAIDLSRIIFSGAFS